MDDRRLDGNAIGGDLLELFGAELTVAFAVCRSCGAHDRMAEMHVYRDAPGIVGRCCRCEAVLVRIVQAPGRAYLDLGGIASLELPLPSPGSYPRQSP